MITFLKKNGAMISKLVVNQLAMMIFGLVVTFAVTSYAYETDRYTLLTTAVSVFSILFYLALLLIATNEQGAQDEVRIRAGRLERDPLLGAKWALAAGSVNLALGVCVLITDLISTLIGTFPALTAVYAFSRTVAMLLQAPYIGLISLYCPNNPIVFILIPLPAIAVCAYGYWIGSKGTLLIKEKRKK